MVSGFSDSKIASVKIHGSDISMGNWDFSVKRGTLQAYLNLLRKLKVEFLEPKFRNVAARLSSFYAIVIEHQELHDLP